MGRRSALALVAAVGSSGLAGCATFRDRAAVGNSGATDVVVHSGASEPRTVSVTVTETGAEEPHTSRTLDLSPGETVNPLNDSKLPTNTGYRVEAALEDGPTETFEWDDPTVERAPLWVFVDDSQNIKFLLQAG